MLYFPFIKRSLLILLKYYFFITVIVNYNIKYLIKLRFNNGATPKSI